MSSSPMDRSTRQKLLSLQQHELTDSQIYHYLASSVESEHNRSILLHIAENEQEHYNIWKKYTGRDVQPDHLRRWSFDLLSRLFGLTFGLKLMQRLEARKQPRYQELERAAPDARRVLEAGEAHENQLIGMLNEERLLYVSAIVLGLTDALVEFTGALAGYTFALQNTRLIAMTGLITGVAAALSMAASEYLSQRSERGSMDPFRAAIYTGGTYIITVILLVLPFLLLVDPYVALPITLAAAIIAIYVFTYYMAIARDLNFWRRFGEIAAISMGVAALSFIIGIGIKIFLNVNI